MTVMDEASQCNTAVSLTPIIRGRKLMLVGDPQQLNPVILLDETSNERLRRKYMVPDEYDYRKNSIYKTYLACDPVSDEVLLRYHYRCSPKIIEFNNKKYYNSRLLIRSREKEDSPLVYMDMEDGKTDYKNTAPRDWALSAHNKRRWRDLNPRAGITDLPLFESGPFNHLGTSPDFCVNCYIIHDKIRFG